MECLAKVDVVGPNPITRSNLGSPDAPLATRVDGASYFRAPLAGRTGRRVLGDPFYGSFTITTSVAGFP